MRIPDAVACEWRQYRILSRNRVRAMLDVALFSRWTKVPFASAHAADPETVRSGWVVGLLTMALFSFAGAAVQAALLSSPIGIAWYVVAHASVAGAVYVARRRAEHVLDLQFEVESSESVALNLSEALR